jgi:hypothetical protein
MERSLLTAVALAIGAASVAQAATVPLPPPRPPQVSDCPSVDPAAKFVGSDAHIDCKEWLAVHLQHWRAQMKYWRAAGLPTRER